MNRRKMNTIIAIAGLAVTTSTIAFFFSIFHKFMSSEGFMKNADRVVMNTYAVRYDDDGDHGSGMNYKFTKDYIESIDGVIAHTISGQNLNSHWVDEARIAATLGYVDEGFDDVFNMKMIRGAFLTKEHVENEEKVIVLSELKAMEIFGTIEVIGKTTDVYSELFTIIGVYENIPEIYSTAFIRFAYDEMIPITLDPFKDRAIDESRGTYRYSSAVLLKSPDLVSAAKEKMHENAKQYIAYDERKLHIHPLTLKDMFMTNIYGFEGEIVNFQLRNVLNAILILAAILIIITALNLSNLQISTVYNRIVELGVRQSFGAYNKHIFGQFSIEIFINASIAAGLSVILLLIDLYLFSSFKLFANTNFDLTFANVSIAIVLSYIIGFLTILFPMTKLFLSRPSNSLKGVLV